MYCFCWSIRYIIFINNYKDGTNAYTKGILDAVTILVGLAYENKPLLGVVGHPVDDNN